jgi:hypothetical protein
MPPVSASPGQDVLADRLRGPGLAGMRHAHRPSGADPLTSSPDVGSVTRMALTSPAFKGKNHAHPHQWSPTEAMPR